MDRAPMNRQTLGRIAFAGAVIGILIVLAWPFVRHLFVAI
jgi:hypothetical protein